MECVHGNRVNNLRFADDIDIIEQSNEKLQDTVDKLGLHTESDRYGMHIDIKDKEIKKKRQKQRLAAFIRHSIRQGFCAPDFANFSDIIDHADGDLFKQIFSNPNHVLAPPLPVKAESHYRPTTP